MSVETAQPLKAFLRTRAAELGLDEIGFTHPHAITHAAPRLASFLLNERHGEMEWMSERAHERSSPAVLWSEARSVIMIGQSYAPPSDPLVALNDKLRGAISVYAQGRDYHDVLKKKIKQLAREFAERADADVKVFVDTAPLMEKPLAEAAGLGWQGKHTNLVSKKHGSWLFLGAILTTANIEPDARESDHCGSCTRCLDICPTKAFPAPYQLDARRCVAYLTIEHKGSIAREFREAIGNRVFGCDDCLAVCPWNKFAENSREQKYAARAETGNPPLLELLAMDDAQFRARFAGTPIKRTGRNRVVRNALIAAGNSRDRRLVEPAKALLSDAEPLVREMAVWALSRLANNDDFSRLRTKYSSDEQDPGVISEWHNAGATQGL